MTSRVAPPTGLPTTQRARHSTLVLAAIVLVGLALRLAGIDRPLVDHHSWRQCDSAALARNFVEEDASPLRPRVDWRGTTSGEVEWNFPAYSYVVSLAYRIVGEHERVGRLVSIVFSLGGLLLLYELLRRTVGQLAALSGAAYLAINPLAVFFGRTVMPEAMLLCASVGFLLAMDRWASEPRRRWLIVGTGCLALAGLIKVPFGFLVVPGAALLVARRGWRALLDARVFAGGLLALLFVIAWYAHAHRLGVSTGLTFAPIWDIGADKWANGKLLLDAAFWQTMAERFVRYVTPAGFAVLVPVGVIFATRGAQARWIPAYLVGALIYLVVIAGGHYAHTYYQVAFLPGIAAAFGIAAQRLFEVQAGMARPLRVAVLASSLVLVAAGLAEGQKRLRQMRRPRADFVAAGQAAAALTVSGDKIIALGSCCLPEPFYYSQRKGWSANGVTDPAWVEARRAEGARAAVLLTTYDTPVDALSCESALGRWLVAHYPTSEKGRNYRVLDLHEPLRDPLVEACESGR